MCQKESLERFESGIHRIWLDDPEFSDVSSLIPKFLFRVKSSGDKSSNKLLHYSTISYSTLIVFSFPHLFGNFSEFDLVHRFA